MRDLLRTTNIKAWILRLGMVRASLVLAFLATIVSFVIASIAVIASGGRMTAPSIIASTVTPALTAGLFSAVILRLIYDLDEAEKRNKKLATTDDLTGIRNRRSFIELAEREMSIARRYGRQFTLMLFDVDNLKHINDRYGHLAGDRVLKQIAQSCKSIIRETDVLARLGGDEFVVLITQSENLDLEDYMQRIHRCISEIDRLDEVVEPITVSMGAHRYTEGIEDIDELFRLADEAMYSSKQAKPVTVRS
jgi:diguanylate cyclase (GGDEF)-like protein